MKFVISSGKKEALTYNKLFKNIKKDLLLRMKNKITTLLIFKNYKSAFDSFKNINSEAYLGPL